MRMAVNLTWKARKAKEPYSKYCCRLAETVNHGYEPRSKLWGSYPPLCGIVLTAFSALCFSPTQLRTWDSPASLRSWDNSSSKFQSQMTFRLRASLLKLGTH